MGEIFGKFPLGKILSIIDGGLATYHVCIINMLQFKELHKQFAIAVLYILWPVL